MLNDNSALSILSQPNEEEFDINQFISPNLFPKASSETIKIHNTFDDLDNYEYVKSLRCDKKNRSYGIIGIQPQSIKKTENK